MTKGNGEKQNLLAKELWERNFEEMKVVKIDNEWQKI